MRELSQSQTMNPIILATRRPIATSMLFLAIALLGIFSWFRLPVELLPSFSGDKLFVQFYRPGSDPDIVENEILIPLESRIEQLPGIRTTWGEVSGSMGSLNIEFDPDSDHRIRELELQQIAAGLTRTQPEGTQIRVSSQNTDNISRFVLALQVIGGDDKDFLRNFVEQRVVGQVEAVSGVSLVSVFGGARREVAIWVDAERCAQLGIRVSQVQEAVRNAVGDINFIGTAEHRQQRITVNLDNRIESLEALKSVRITEHMPTLLGHVARVEIAPRPKSSVSRVNGQASVSMVVYQDQGANLVALGDKLRDKIEVLREQLKPFGVELLISFDASAKVDEQLTLLKQLALSGFLIALLVLFLFLRQIRAILVVAISVPVSMLAAGALLFLGGYSLNLITLFGLVIGVGMLVDNSIVVYEAVLRNLEKGIDAEQASALGIKTTLRAILAASATNAIVFLPLMFLQDIPVSVVALLKNIVPAILFPLVASLLVAVGLVPLLTQRLAAPAAQSKLKEQAALKKRLKGARQPKLAKELLGAALKQALRRPSSWVMGTTIAVILTVVIGLPWVMIQTIAKPPTEASQIRYEVEFDSSGSIEAAGLVFEKLERAMLGQPGVLRVESTFQEEQGTLVVDIKPPDQRPVDVNAATIRARIEAVVSDTPNIQGKPLSSNSNANQSGTEVDALGNEVARVAISGPDMAELHRMAKELQERLQAIPQIGSVNVRSRKSIEELHVTPDSLSLYTHQMYYEQAFQIISSIGREGQNMRFGYNLPDGQVLPVVIRRINDEEISAIDNIKMLDVVTPEATIAFSELVELEKVIPPTTITHQNGKREISVYYRLVDDAPMTGPLRQGLDKQIEQVIHATYLPADYTISSLGGSESIDWFNVAVIPILFLLFALLAMTFESLTLPLLVLCSVPLTILGAVWALLLGGFGADMMAIVGVVVLFGLTVNPAILLVDRMQQGVYSKGLTSGSAALAAVKERVRPVLMTSCTTIAGLWPLAIAQGQELEIWPPFATVIIGGLITATLLTLFIIPIGFLGLHKVDSLAKQLGIWKVMTIAGATALVILPLNITGVIISPIWLLLATFGLFAMVFWLFVKVCITSKVIELDQTNISIETRHLSKIYGRAGALTRVWHRYQNFKGQFNQSNAEQRQQLLLFAALSSAMLYLGFSLQGALWVIGFTFAGVYFVAKFTSTILHWLLPSVSSFAGKGAFLVPWLAVATLLVSRILLPLSQNQATQLSPVTLAVVAVFLLMIQRARKTADLIAQGELESTVTFGRFKVIKNWWRKFSFERFAWGVQKSGFTALGSLNFKAKAGMIGILGPNGAGKTTLFRTLAGILTPTVGTIYYGGVDKRILGKRLSRYIGFLPQEFGLPEHMTGRDYLDYFAILHELGDKAERDATVQKLLADVGLSDKQNEQIKGYSGGMKQRLAVAQTLLTQPSIIIVDEPTAGLDPKERIRFRNLLSKLAKDRIVLFSTHVIEDVAASCERVVVLKRGCVVYDGDPRALAQLAQNKVWRLCLGVDEASEIEQQYNVISQSANLDNTVNLRVLAQDKPHDAAQVTDSTLEDGYFELFTKREQEAVNG